MQKGWDATGRLKPLWDRLPGKRDELAERTGIRPQTLSAYNSGKRSLGILNATRIADVLDVSVEDLGAPDKPEAVALSDGRLKELVRDAVREILVEEQFPRLGQLADAVARLEESVERMEGQLAGQAGQRGRGAAE